MDWGQVGKEAAVCAVSGAISGLAGPEAGWAARAAIDTAASVGGQVASNALTHKPLGDGVGMAAVTGLASSVGMAAAVHYGGQFLGGAARKTVNRVTEGCGCACGRSFSADTLVVTPTGGEQAIGTLQVGDQVQAYDPATGQSSAQTVEHVWVNHDSDLLDVTLLAAASATAPSAAASADTKQRDAEVASHGLRAPPSANGGDEEQHRNDPQGNGQHREQHEVVHTTANHPWLTADRGFVLAGTLQPGESVVRLDGSTATVAAVRVVPGEADYYNLTVSTLHTYAVGTGQFVVHNYPLHAYSMDGGHHIFAKEGFKTSNGNYVAGYSEKNALAISNSDLRANGWNHNGRGGMTQTQRRLFGDLARSGRPNTIQEHTRIAYESLQAGGVPKKDAFFMVVAARRQLRNWGVHPTKIPWH